MTDRSAIVSSVIQAVFIRTGWWPSASSQPTPRAVMSMSVAEKPRRAQESPRITSELVVVVVRNAQRRLNRSRSEVGTTSAVGRWVAMSGMIPAARQRATMSRAGGVEVGPLLRRADDGGVERQLVDDEHPQRQPVLGRDVAW